MTVGIATARDLEPMDQDDDDLRDALEARGISAELAVWNDPEVAWERYDRVVIRSTWDYTADRDAFVAWAEQVEAVTPLDNSAAVVRWNTHKGYLMELEDRGAPVVPTAWLARGAEVDLERLLAERGWDDVVVKPAVGAGAEGLVRVPAGQVGLGQHHLDALLRAGDVMIQPFLRRIGEDGELSVIVIDGSVTHAIRKRPAAGEIRIQIEHGGRYERVDPTPAQSDLAAWIVETVGHDLLYARVDLVPDDTGTWQLSELEATEPSLYLSWAPDAADRLAAAIQRRL